MRIALFIGLSFLLLFNCGANAGFEQGLEAYKRGDYVTAFQELSAAASRSNSDAMVLLFKMYSGGCSVARDDEKALDLLTQAATANNAHAQFMLALVIMYKNNFPSDEAAHRKFEKLIQQSAEQGFSEAMRVLGGLRVGDGKEIVGDPVQAYAWFGLAVRRAMGVPEGYRADFISLIRGNMDRVAAKLLPEQIERATLLIEQLDRQTPLLRSTIPVDLADCKPSGLSRPVIPPAGPPIN